MTSPFETSPASESLLSLPYSKVWIFVNKDIITGRKSFRLNDADCFGPIPLSFDLASPWSADGKNGFETDPTPSGVPHRQATEMFAMPHLLWRESVVVVVCLGIKSCLTLPS